MIVDRVQVTNRPVHARANFSELAEEVKGGAEKIITKNGASYIALIDPPSG